MYKFSIFLIVIILFPIQAKSANWSRLITTQNRDDVTISFRQKRKDNAWLVQWQVNNNSQSTVEPFLKYRNYLCEDDTQLNFSKSTLGVFLPKSKRYGDIKDGGICPNSKIKLVEIETVIIPTHIKKAHDKNSSIK